MCIIEAMATVQVRDVPEEVVAALKERASATGLSLSEYLRQELTRMSRQSTIEEIWETIKSRGDLAPTSSIADLIRQDRDAR